MALIKHVVGFENAPNEAKKFHDIYRLCKELSICAPTEVYDYCSHCRYEDEIPIGRPVDLDQISKIFSGPDGSIVCIEINVLDIPKDIKTIRFINS